MEKYYSEILSKIWLIAIVAVILGGSAFAYSYLKKVPTYSAHSSIYISRRSLDSEGKEILSYYDLLSGELVATDCKGVIPSVALLGPVAGKLGYSYDDLAMNVNVSAGNSARTIVVSYTDTDSARASVILGEVLEAFLANSEDYFPSTRFDVLNTITVDQNTDLKSYMYLLGGGFLGMCMVMTILVIQVNIKTRKLRVV